MITGRRYPIGIQTIKDYDREGEIYTLSIPNQEVRIGYTQGLMPTYLGLDSADVQIGFALKFWRALKKGDADLAMQELQSYMEGVSYVKFNADTRLPEDWIINYC